MGILFAPTLELFNSSTQTILVILLVTLAIILSTSKPNSKLSATIPSPVALPIIGHLHLLGHLPHQSLQRIALRHGPLFRVRLGSIDYLAINSPSTVKSFLKNHETTFANRATSTGILHLAYDGSDMSFAPYSPHWVFMRKLTMTQLLGGKTIDKLHLIRKEEIKRLLRGFYDKSRKGERVNLPKEFIGLASSIVSRMSVGRQWAGKDDELAELKTVINELEEILGLFDFKDHIWVLKQLGKLGIDFQGIDSKVEEVKGKYDRMVERVLRAKEAERQQLTRKKDGGEGMVKDILDLLMDVHDDENAEKKLTRENIKSYILNILAAGTSTSALTIEWALAEMMNHPNVLRKLLNELDTIVGKDRLIEESDLPRLPYLHAIIKETLRLHCPIPMVARKGSEDCTIDGHFVPAGTPVFVNYWAVGRDPEFWKNPLEFNPERFTGDDNLNDIDFRGQHFQLLPFGTGRRMCPGITLALFVVKTGFAALVQCFDWPSAEGSVDMTEGPGITLTRAKPLHIFCCLPASLSPLPVSLRLSTNLFSAQSYVLWFLTSDGDLVGAECLFTSPHLICKGWASELCWRIILGVVLAFFYVGLGCYRYLLDGK
ncbi:Cytochrome P450 93A3 [Rhynchospora pubera]|uniref:Cytochrome P450 93A3 n=1 Tax=Rhynchospora pubera TaxID=906938 RepID=A0AAV8H494_9POAL|nr:Cytochrome P450 93A3 [Rhynchospora pubera]